MTGLEELREILDALDQLEEMVKILEEQQTENEQLMKENENLKAQLEESLAVNSRLNSLTEKQQEQIGKLKRQILFLQE